MFLSFGVVLNAILLVLGILWCRFVFGHFRSDVTRLRESRDPAEKHVILFFWSITAVVLVLMVDFVGGLLGV
ncbi:MAG: hypothetical protein ACYTDY_02910 [Planctomycetota bacterium]|jgi:hypothetical protein